MQHTELLRWLCFSDKLKTSPLKIQTLHCILRRHHQLSLQKITPCNFRLCLQQWLIIVDYTQSTCSFQSKYSKYVVNRYFHGQGKDRVISLSRFHYRTSLLMHSFFVFDLSIQDMSATSDTNSSLKKRQYSMQELCQENPFLFPLWTAMYPSHAME